MSIELQENIPTQYRCPKCGAGTILYTEGVDYRPDYETFHFWHCDNGECDAWWYPGDETPSNWKPPAVVSE